jgi:DNA polymerase-1
MLQTFIRPWSNFSRDGWMHTTWHQVRGSENGARTGRPSSSEPNFFNMPKAVKDDVTRGFVMPRHIKGLPELPKIRNYIIPDAKGHVIGRRDFNQQELRVTAHFEDGALLAAYLGNPRLDVHGYLQGLIAELLQMDVDRTFVKTLNFGYLYGQGLGAMAASLGVEMGMIKQLRDAQMAALPGLKALTDGIKARVREGLPITTWGGRQYYCEEPRFSEKFGRVMTFDYKLLNYLIQGSAADITKTSIIRYDEARKEGRFILSVYDENNISVPEKALKSEMLILREAMMSIQLDVPLLSDGEWGPRLGSLQPLEEPAPDLSKWNM